MDEKLYAGREQSWVKHQILKKCLVESGLIIGYKAWESFTYVDGFSGPWESKSATYDDTSFTIAFEQMRAARDRLEQNGRELKLRAVLVELDEKRFERLDQHVSKIPDIDIKSINSQFEEAVPRVVNFIKSSSKNTFPFVFIDPTGWTGFALENIRPILELPKCDVLINFMTKDIVRFIEDERSYDSFEKLFGSGDFRDELKGTRGVDRVDAAVFKYRDAVSAAGDFSHTGVAFILDPKKSRTHFNLVYLSKHWRGLNAFKNAEKSSMKEMERMRAKVEQDNRQSKTQQLEFFSPEDAPESSYYSNLRDRYLKTATEQTIDLIRNNDSLLYDKVCDFWLRHPMVWESDLKDWMEELKKKEIITIKGLAPNSRRPQRNKKHLLIWNH